MWVPGEGSRGPRLREAPPAGTRDRVVLSEFRNLAGHVAVTSVVACLLIAITAISVGPVPPNAVLSMEVQLSLYSSGALFPFLVAGTLLWRHYLVALASAPAVRMQAVSTGVMLLLMGGAVSSFFSPDPLLCLLWAQAAPAAVLAAIAFPYSRRGGRWPKRFLVASLAGAALPLALLAIAALSKDGFLQMAAQIAFISRSSDTLLPIVPVVFSLVVEAPLFASLRVAPLRLRSEPGVRAR